MEARRTCVLWSGGKDSFLSFVPATTEMGVASEDSVFVTFVPAVGEFLCHPLGLLEAHSAFWSVPHEFVIIEGEEWVESYRRAFRYLRAKYGVSQVLTGDIMFQNQGLDRYWLAQLLAEEKLQLVMPLATLFAEQILEALNQLEIEAVVSVVKEAYYADRFLGRRISLELLQAVGHFDNHSFDLCGEHGEYHTTVIRYRDHDFLASFAEDIEHRKQGTIWSLAFPREVLTLRAPRVPVPAV